MSGTILSISSYTAYDYCGNKITSAVLQILGHDVAMLNTTNLSNPLGPLYPKSAGGSILSAEDFRKDFVPFWRENNLTLPEMIIVGYLPSVDLVHAIADFIDEFPPRFLVVDPIFGDHGRFYNSPEIVEPFRTRLLPKADLITPNYFEACLLSDTEFSNSVTEDDLNKVSQKLHDIGAKQVVISSADFDESRLISILSSKKEQRSFFINKLNCYVLGTGDFFTGILSHLLLENGEISFDNYQRTIDLTGKLMKLVLEKGKKDMNPFMMIDEIRKI